jgi:beta-N-acetylhexosaminidase
MKNTKMYKIATCILLVLSLSAQGQTLLQDSLGIKIGQMIMIGYGGTSFRSDDPVIAEIRAGSVGGIILFEKNLSDSNAVSQVTSLIGSLQKASEVPLFMAIDQEGGKVNRLKTKYGFPKSVTAAYLGELDNEDSTRYYARTTAEILNKTGFNVNFAPVLDLAINPDNPVIVKFGRSYGADPKMVVKHAEIMIEEHNKQKIITVGKHFPGHGSSESDTHYGVADVTKSWDKSELIPYKRLTSDGQLPGVMSAHIVNTNLDPSGLPGTLSKPILQGILRDKIGFNGVVFSDDMQMHAITKEFGLEKAIELGINAGLDVIIFSNNIQDSKERTVDVVHKIIRTMVEDGRIPKERIDESYARIIKLKKSYFYD